MPEKIELLIRNFIRFHFLHSQAKVKQYTLKIALLKDATAAFLIQRYKTPIDRKLDSILLPILTLNLLITGCA